MAWSKDEQDLVFQGVELGIAPSPTKGVANLQNLNINTSTGEAMASFARFKQNQAAITNGTLTASVSDGAVLLDAPANLQAGQWITVSASTIGSVTSSASYLLVGGGGGGGGSSTTGSSGGGGGGQVSTGSFTPTITSYPITVGTGGTGGSVNQTGTTGGNSLIGTVSSIFWTLVVGGGGGGGGAGGGGTDGAGGGGGAEVVEDTTTLMPAGTYTITVGAGGASATSGGTSSISGIATAIGGGAGGSPSGGAHVAGKKGGNGGGAGGGSGGGGSQPGGTGKYFAGGSAPGGGEPAGGGGGGMGANGTNGSAGVGGNGGAGVASTITGSSVSYAGGGGGARPSGTGGTGAAGGGDGSSGNANGSNATANTGSGGGGAGYTGGGDKTGGTGGSGVVIIRFPTASITVSDSTGASSSTSGSDTILTWTSSGTFAFTYNTVTGYVALGGGGGASPSAWQGGSGGSGGGAASGDLVTVSITAYGTGVGANNGGAGNNTTRETGGGGAGNSASGSNASGTSGGNGGNGTSSSISGSSVTYGGGGGGGGNDAGASAGTGGTGGGGSGLSGVNPTLNQASYGTNGLGGGGGGNAAATGAFATAGAPGGTGIVIISYATGTMTATGGAITYSGGNTIHTFNTSGTFTVHSIAAAGQYFVSYKNSSNKIKLSAIFDPYGLYPIVHGTTGTATFSTLAVVNQAISKATEKYNTDDSVEYRYYILDDNGYVWVYDTQVYATTLATNGVGEAWMLPDPTDYSAEEFNSIAILNGWLLVLNNSEIQGKPTVDLGRAFAILERNGVDVQLINPFPTHNNFALVGHQGKMYYCDGNYVGEIFPTTSLATTSTNTQTYARVTGTGTTVTIQELISGSTPYALSGNAVSGLTQVRIPIVFFASETGVVPVGITEGRVYYAGQSTTNNREFSVYTASSGGTAQTITTVGSGTYVNTFYPLGNQQNTAAANVTLFTLSTQRLNLPTYETAQCMVEVGNTVLIGGKTNTLYPWNQVSALPTDLIALPEADVKTMINVNNMAYVFAGNKGNIYISNNSSASLVLKVPDYCAGVPGTPLTYIEPRFSWGDAIYLRGRVYFSILDQTSTKAGNCGGVWSFVPSQNFYYGQDTGLQLRLENQNSYGDYDGMATILLANENQNAIAPQYWAAWQDSYSEATSTAFGIDQTDDIPVTTFVIETDLIPVGTFHSKTTFGNFEFKMTTPFISGDSVALFWRKNSTDAWTAFSDQELESTTPLSGEYSTNAENLEWLQLRGVFTTNGTTTSSFDRFKEFRVK